MLFATGTRRWTQIIEFHRLTLDTQHVVSLVDHPAVLGSILDFYSVTDATQAQTLNAQLVVRIRPVMLLISVTLTVAMIR